jgi:hypothetical protein
VPRVPGAPEGWITPWGGASFPKWSMNGWPASTRPERRTTRLAGSSASLRSGERGQLRFSGPARVAAERSIFGARRLRHHEGAGHGLARRQVSRAADPSGGKRNPRSDRARRDREPAAHLSAWHRVRSGPPELRAASTTGCGQLDYDAGPVLQALGGYRNLHRWHPAALSRSRVNHQRLSMVSRKISRTWSSKRGCCVI